MKKFLCKAFTLAEVLITLGIIGIVAAMTLPTLVQNYKNQVLFNQAKQNYSIVQNAMQNYANSIGFPGDYTFLTSLSNHSKFRNGLAKHFKTQKICTIEEVNQGKC